MVLTVLLIGGVIFLHRLITSEPIHIVAEKEEQGYHLNDSLQNALSDLPSMKRMDQYIERWMSRNAIKGASLAVMRGVRRYCGWDCSMIAAPISRCRQGRNIWTPMRCKR